jgi:hypothetical protein
LTPTIHCLAAACRLLIAVQYGETE